MSSSALPIFFAILSPRSDSFGYDFVEALEGGALSAGIGWGTPLSPFKERLLVGSRGCQDEAIAGWLLALQTSSGSTGGSFYKLGHQRAVLTPQHRSQRSGGTRVWLRIGSESFAFLLNR
jgi:hypothetical protein